jgi:hypothetical protein
MLNNAFEDADAFRKMLDKVATRSEIERMVMAQRVINPEIQAWNAEIERKRAEKKARKAQHTKALDGLR